MNNKAKYNLKTREDISNPFHGMSHDSLLKAAGVRVLKAGEFTVEKLQNGRIIVKEKAVGHKKKK